MSQPFWFDDPGRTPEERSMQGVAEIREARKLDIKHKLTLCWCLACAEGQHIRCDDKIMIDKSCECSLCASIEDDVLQDKLAEDED